MNNSKIQFIDTSAECKKMMVKLSKDALRNSGKVITKILRSTVPVRTGGLKKSITAWAKIDRKTGQPLLEVGYRTRAQMRKRGFAFFVNPTWFEFGTKPHSIHVKNAKSLTDGKSKFGLHVENPGMSSKNFLRNTVYQNIDKIRAAQEEKLGELTNLMIKEGAKIDLGGDEEVE